MQEAKNVWRKKNKGRKWPRPDVVAASFSGGPDREEGGGAEDLTFAARRAKSEEREEDSAVSSLCHSIAAQTIHALWASHLHSPSCFHGQETKPQARFHHLPNPCP